MSSVRRLRDGQGNLWKASALIQMRDDESSENMVR